MEFTVTTLQRSSIPRSNRLRNGGSVFTRSSTGTAPSHEHSNKSILDSFTEIDDEGYLFLKHSNDNETVVEKVKSGYSDDSAKWCGWAFNDLFEYVNVGSEDSPIYALRIKIGVFSDSFVSSKGVSSYTGDGSGVGVDLSAVWQSLISNTDAFGTTKIHIDHIPTLTSAKISDFVSSVEELIPTNVSAFSNDAGYITASALVNKADASRVTVIENNYVAKTRKITAGTGLSGGGDLSADRTLSLATVGTAGTYTKVVVDAYGRVTGNSTLLESDIPALSIGKITNLQSTINTLNANFANYLPLTGGAMKNTNLVANLNADLLDGYNADTLIKGQFKVNTQVSVSAAGWYTIASVATNGFNERGTIHFAIRATGGDFTPYVNHYYINSSWAGEVSSILTNGIGGFISGVRLVQIGVLNNGTRCVELYFSKAFTGYLVVLYSAYDNDGIINDNFTWNTGVLPSADTSAEIWKTLDIWNGINTDKPIRTTSTAYANSLIIGGATITWDSVNGMLKVDKGAYFVGAVSSKGVSNDTGSGSGVGVDLSAVWQSLTSNTDAYGTTKIHIDHIPLLSVAKISDFASTVESLLPTNVSQFANDAGYITSSAITNKADKATTLDGYGITDAVNLTTQQTINPAKTFTNGIILPVIKGLNSQKLLSLGDNLTYDGKQIAFTDGLIANANNANWLIPNSDLAYGNSGLQYFNFNGTQGTTANANVAPYNEWYHIIRQNHGNSYGYFTDIASPLNSHMIKNGLFWRAVSSGINYGWYNILDSNNYSNYAVTLSTDQTITGNKTFRNSGYYTGIFNSTLESGEARLLLMNNNTTKLMLAYDGLGSFLYDYGSAQTLRIQNDGHLIYTSFADFANDISTKGWFVNKELNEGLYNEAGQQRWYYRSDDVQKGWYSTTDVIAANQLVSVLATGTAPLKVYSTTMVNNLNANYLGGLNKDNFQKGLYDFINVSGTADTTNLPTVLAPSNYDGINTLGGVFKFYDTKFYNSQSNTANRTQLAYGYDVDSIHFRRYNGGSWNAWKEVAFTDVDLLSPASGTLTVNNNISVQNSLYCANGDISLGSNGVLISAAIPVNIGDYLTVNNGITEIWGNAFFIGAKSTEFTNNVYILGNASISNLIEANPNSGILSFWGDRIDINAPVNAKSTFKIGEATLSWDSANGMLKVDKGAYFMGPVSTKGVSNDTGGMMPIAQFGIEWQDSWNVDSNEVAKFGNVSNASIDEQQGTTNGSEIEIVCAAFAGKKVSDIEIFTFGWEGETPPNARLVPYKISGNTLYCTFFLSGTMTTTLFKIKVY